MGYKSARAGVAVSDTPLGPFRFVRSGRINAGILPKDFIEADTTELRQRLSEQRLTHGGHPLGIDR